MDTGIKDAIREVVREEIERFFSRFPRIRISELPPGTFPTNGQEKAQDAPVEAKNEPDGQKRHRRTKAEMEEARRLEAENTAPSVEKKKRGRPRKEDANGRSKEITRTPTEFAA